jgi:hypothetical protein
MLNVLLTYSPAAGTCLADLGSGVVVVGFLWLPFPVLIVGCVALWCFAAMPRANRPGGCGPRGGRRHQLWVYPVVICIVVLASRGLKDHGHGTVIVDPHAATVFHRDDNGSDARLEERLERLGDQLEQRASQVELRASQLEGKLDHGAVHLDGQVERGAAHLQQQLERVAAQIERQLEHVGRQISHAHREVSPAVVVAQAGEEPAVIEPNPPALPVLGQPQREVMAQVAAPAAPPSTPVPPTTQAPSAQPSPAAPPAAAAPVAGPPAKADAEAKTDVQSDKLPEWAKTEIVEEGNRKLVVVPGGFAGSQKEAEHDALDAARLVVGDAIQRVYPRVGKWLPTADAVREEAVRRTYVEQIHRKTVSSGTPFIVYRAYQQVELSPEVFAKLVSSWKEEVLPHRLEALGGLAALLTLTFATGAAYFRLDDRTQGRYRRRLALAAVAIVGAGAAAAAALI